MMLPELTLGLIGGMSRQSSAVSYQRINLFVQRELGEAQAPKVSCSPENLQPSKLFNAMAMGNLL